jgi:hypothetical protein
MSVQEEWEMVCPGCLIDEMLDVTACVLVRLVGNGTDADESVDGSHEWDDTSACQCANCGWHGTVHDAELAFTVVSAVTKLEKPNGV